MLGMKLRAKLRAFGLLEAVIAVFLLSYAALIVLSLIQSGFIAQRRSQQMARANLVAQSVVADIRIWAEDIDNYRGDWADYKGTYSPPGFPDYNVTIKVVEDGRPIYSPCSELESQWEGTERGSRKMPNAIVPVEVKVAWSDDLRDQLTVLTYIGEPRRDTAGINFHVTGPSNPTLAMNQTSRYTVRATDAAGRGLDNLLFLWVPDVRYVTPTARALRDGREFEVIRDRVVVPPDVPPPAPPRRSPVTCYTYYAGEYLNANIKGLELSL